MYSEYFLGIGMPSIVNVLLFITTFYLNYYYYT